MSKEVKAPEVEVPEVEVEWHMVGSDGTCQSGFDQGIKELLIGYGWVEAE